MAKKKTGSRKPASRGARKGARKTARKGARAARPTPAATPHIAATLTREKDRSVSKVTWNRRPTEINLTPLKAILQAHIEQLSRVSPTDDVTRTMKLLQDTKTALGDICGLSMEVPTKVQL